MRSSDVVANRWEWRMFAQAPFGDRLAHRVRNPAEPPSEETYILSRSAPHNVKIRGGRLEIKTLVALDSNGLEQWRPTLRATFPIGAAEVVAAYQAWALRAPTSMPRRASIERFLADVVAETAALRPVRITKRRSALTDAGCAGEFVELITDHQTWISVAVEDEDPGRVLAAVRRLGLADRDNENYPAALKRIVGFTGTPVPSRMEDDL